MKLELTIDLVALVLVAAGIWLLFEPAGLVVAGIGLWWLGIGVQARRKTLRESARWYQAIEMDD